MTNPPSRAARGPGVQTDLLQRALGYERDGRWRQAREHYRRVVDSQPSHLEALCLLGDLERRHGDLPSAIRLLRAAAELAPRRADIFETLGRALAAAGDPAGARDEFTRALAADPDYAPAYVSLGDQWRRKGFMDEARRHYLQARERDPTQAGAHLGLGHVLVGQGRYARAEQAFRDALTVQPSLYDARVALARLLNERRDFPAARELFEQCLAQRSGDVRVDTGLAYACLQLGLLTAAGAALERALSHEPRAVTALAVHGGWELARGHVAAARKSFALALTRAPRLRMARLGMVAVRVREHDYLNALTDFNDIELGAADNPDITVLHARILLGLGRWQAARCLLRNRLAGAKGSALVPRDRYAIHAALGAVEEEAGQMAGALHHFTLANVALDRRYDARGTRQQAARAQAFFGANTRLPRARACVCVPLLVVGLPSAGVSLVHQAMRAHSACIPVASRWAIGDLAAAMPGRVASAQSYPDCLGDYRRDELTALAREVWPAAFAGQPGTVGILDGGPDDDLYLGLYATLFPQLRVVHCERDRGDLEMACFRHDYAGPPRDYAVRFEDIAERARVHDQTLGHWRRSTDIAVLTCRREHLIAHPVEGVERLLGFLGLAFEPACLAAIAPLSVAPASAFHTPLADPGIGRGRRYARVRGG